MFMARLTGDVCGLTQRPLGEYGGGAQQASETEAVGREKTLDCGVEVFVVGDRYWSNWRLLVMLASSRDECSWALSEAVRIADYMRLLKHGIRRGPKHPNAV